MNFVYKLVRFSDKLIDLRDKLLKKCEELKKDDEITKYKIRKLIDEYKNQKIKE